MASIRDVAKMAGVSISTVSRVVSGSARVEPDTRAKVHEVIERTGYRPNINARSLRSRSGQLVGLVVPSIVNEAFSQIIHFAEAEAYKMGYGLIVGNTNDDPVRERKFIDDFLSRHVDAILFTRVSDLSRIQLKAHEQKIPIVAIDRGTEHEEVPSVELDNVEAGRLVAKLFSTGGHRTVAMVAGPQTVRLARERRAGFQKGLADAGIDLLDRYWFEGPFAFETGLDAVETFLQLDPRPTAIWAHADLMAMGVMHALCERGIAVPDEVSVVGMDNVPIARMAYPPLTTVDQPFDEFCTRAFRIIHEQLENPLYRPPTNLTLVRPSVVLRKSYRNRD